jgi:hypothetical protein
MTVTEFTLVRNRRYAEGANPDYEGAVEAVELGVGQASLVRSAGGTVFATRQAAGLAEYLANRAVGPLPSRASASGYFSSLRIGGAEIYVDSR